MVELPAPSRTRNAAATRQAILDAAHNRFAKEGYDGASLREIAADAKVDAALVSRYFGSKEELFVEVLNCAPDASDLFEGTLSDFGARVAAKILDDRDVDQGVEYLLIMLRSASSLAAVLYLLPPTLTHSAASETLGMSSELTVSAHTAPATMRRVTRRQLPCASPMRWRTSGSATWVPAVVSLRLGVVNKAAMVAPVLIGPIRLDSAYLLDVAGGSAVWRAKWPKWGRNRPHAGAGTGAKRKARGRMATPRFIVQLLQPCPYATKK